MVSSENGESLPTRSTAELLDLDGFKEFFHGALNDIFFIDDYIAFALSLLSDTACVAEANESCDKEHDRSFSGLHRSLLAKSG